MPQTDYNGIRGSTSRLPETTVKYSDEILEQAYDSLVTLYYSMRSCPSDSSFYAYLYRGSSGVLRQIRSFVNRTRPAATFAACQIISEINQELVGRLEQLGTVITSKPFTDMVEHAKTLNWEIVFVREHEKAALQTALHDWLNGLTTAVLLELAQQLRVTPLGYLDLLDRVEAIIQERPAKYSVGKLMDLVRIPVKPDNGLRRLRRVEFIGEDL